MTGKKKSLESENVKTKNGNNRIKGFHKRFNRKFY